MKLFLVLILFGLLGFLGKTAFADDPRVLLLEKHRTSGYVMPEDRFVKDCRIFTNGDVEVTIKRPETADGFTAHISGSRVWEIRQLIHIAKHSKIIVGPVRCDAGDNILTGYRHGQPVLIKEEKDCMSIKNRKGWAARRLFNIATRICTF